MALLTRAAPVVGCGAVVSVGSHDAHGHVARIAAALAERAGVHTTPVPDLAAATLALEGLPSPVVCVAADRGLRALTSVPATVLVVGPRYDPRRSPLVGEALVCLDGSTRAEAVLPTVADITRVLHLELWLLSVIAAPDASAMARQPSDLLQSGYLSRAVASLGGPTAVTGWDVLHGHAAAALLDHARHDRVGLLALNSHGASASASTPFGRVPARLVHDSPVPVLLTRTRACPPVVRTRPTPRPTAAPPRLHVVSDADLLAVAARSYLQATAARRATARPPSRWTRRRIAVAIAFVALVLGALACRAPLPYHRFGGTTRPATELVSVTGVPVDEVSASFLVTIVTAEPVTLPGVLGARLGHVDDVHRDPDRVAADLARWNDRELMSEAGATATAVALRRVGVSPSDVRVAVTPHGIGGPSAGLAMALELVDLLSPGDLTGGHVVAVSGALAPDGRVGTVGGIRYKATAARRAGADVLLVPPAVAREAAAYAGDVRVIPVATFAEALEALRSL